MNGTPAGFHCTFPLALSPQTQQDRIVEGPQVSKPNASWALDPEGAAADDAPIWTNQ